MGAPDAVIGDPVRSEGSIPDVSPSVIQTGEHLGVGAVADDGFLELREELSEAVRYVLAVIRVRGLQQRGAP
jgi:hypothetical protein